LLVVEVQVLGKQENLVEVELAEQVEAEAEDRLALVMLELAVELR
jgi:hypothetical protein